MGPPGGGASRVGVALGGARANPSPRFSPAPCAAIKGAGPAVVGVAWAWLNVTRGGATSKGAGLGAERAGLGAGGAGLGEATPPGAGRGAGRSRTARGSAFGTGWSILGETRGGVRDTPTWDTPTWALPSSSGVHR